MENSSGYSVSREAMPLHGAANPHLGIHFSKERRNKPRAKWTDEDKKYFESTGKSPQENYDKITFTLDGGLNVHGRPVRRLSEGNGYFDEDTGEFTDDLIKYSKQWERYEQGLTEEDQAVGYPLKHYFKSDPAKVEQYKHFRIYTVEQLAELPLATQQLVGMGGMTDSAQAKVWLERARGTGPLKANMEELDRANEKISALEKLLEEMIANKGEAPRKKLGRPKKITTEDVIGV